MDDLVKRINEFINKTAIHMTREEAERYGIKLPPEAEEPKWTDGEQKPVEVQVEEKPAQMPKLPKRAKPRSERRTKKPGVRPEPKKRFAPSQATLPEEVAHQLTPKGPGYHSIEDIASDIKESKRLAEKFTGKKLRENRE